MKNNPFIILLLSCVLAAPGRAATEASGSFANSTAAQEYGEQAAEKITEARKSASYPGRELDPNGLPDDLDKLPPEAIQAMIDEAAYIQAHPGYGWCAAKTSDVLQAGEKAAKEAGVDPNIYTRASHAKYLTEALLDKNWRLAQPGEKLTGRPFVVVSYPWDSSDAGHATFWFPREFQYQGQAYSVKTPLQGVATHFGQSDHGETNPFPGGPGGAYRYSQVLVLRN